MTARWFPPWAIVTLVCFAIGSVWLRLAIVGTAYEISQVDRKIDQVRQEKELLLVKMAGLKSPRRLEGLAKNRFGLAPPRADQIVRLDGGKVSGR